MNVEGDFRYVDSGGFDECTDFLEYLNECNHNWEEAFVDWIAVSEKWKEDRGKSQNYWGPLNLVKVLEVLSVLPDITMFGAFTYSSDLRETRSVSRFLSVMLSWACKILSLKF